jgi:hypothetical protein
VKFGIKRPDQKLLEEFNFYGAMSYQWINFTPALHYTNIGKIFFKFYCKRFAVRQVYLISKVNKILRILQALYQ